MHGRAAALGPSQGLVAGDLPALVAELLSDASRWATDVGWAMAMAEGAPVRLVARSRRTRTPR